MQLILCDIHGTLLKNDKVIHSARLILDGLDKLKDVGVCLVTAEPLNHAKLGELKELLSDEDIEYPIYHLGLNHNLKDAAIKEKILHNIKKLHPSCKIILAIDNKKSICKMYEKEGIDSMRFKKE